MREEEAFGEKEREGLNSGDGIFKSFSGKVQRFEFALVRIRWGFAAQSLKKVVAEVRLGQDLEMTVVVRCRFLLIERDGFEITRMTSASGLGAFLSSQTEIRFHKAKPIELILQSSLIIFIKFN